MRYSGIRLVVSLGKSNFQPRATLEMVSHRILQTWTTGSFYVLRMIPDRTADLEMVANREERLMCSGLGVERMGWSCSMNWRIWRLGYFATVHAMVEPRCRSKRSKSTTHRASLEIWVLESRLQLHPSRVSSRYLFSLCGVSTACRVNLLLLPHLIQHFQDQCSGQHRLPRQGPHQIETARVLSLSD